jgi:hypothetical protein
MRKGRQEEWETRRQRRMKIEDRGSRIEDRGLRVEDRARQEEAFDA